MTGTSLLEWLRWEEEWGGAELVDIRKTDVKKLKQREGE